MDAVPEKEQMTIRKVVQTLLLFTTMGCFNTSRDNFGVFQV